MNRCEAAVDPLVKGKRIHVHIAVLDELGIDVRQWLIDLKNAITVEFHDPSDCLEDAYTEGYKVSVKVSGGIATATAKPEYKV